MTGQLAGISGYKRVTSLPHVEFSQSYPLLNLGKRPETYPHLPATTRNLF